tara:strand:- start:365 stop:1162 length:798 start_codon:yes stop_codon:yes gene_type:complete
MDTSIEYKNHTINIINDNYPENPFTDWDCNPSIIFNYDRQLTSYGNIDSDYLPALTKQEIKKNIPAIKDIFDIEDKRSLLIILECNEYSARHNYDNATDYVNDCLTQFYGSSNNSDKLDILYAIYTMKGIICLNGSSQGYCQGDHVDILVIADSDFLKATGATIDSESDLQYAIDLYGAWAWGDVYGYDISDSNGDDIPDNSCWGFYGDNHEKSGLLDNAKSSIDCNIKMKRKRKYDAIKIAIKNNMPLMYRDSFYARRMNSETM